MCLRTWRASGFSILKLWEFPLENIHKTSLFESKGHVLGDLNSHDQFWWATSFAHRLSDLVMLIVNHYDQFHIESRRFDSPNTWPRDSNHVASQILRCAQLFSRILKIRRILQNSPALENIWVCPKDSQSFKMENIGRIRGFPGESSILRALRSSLNPTLNPKS